MHLLPCTQCPVSEYNFSARSDCSIRREPGICRRHTSYQAYKFYIHFSISFSMSSGAGLKKWEHATRPPRIAYGTINERYERRPTEDARLP